MQGSLTVTRKAFQDSPTPAANPMAALVLDRLAHLADRPDFRDKAEATLDLLAAKAADYGLFAATYAIAVVNHFRPPVEIVVVGPSADEKTSIQARQRKHPSLPPAPGRPMRIEHEYWRGGAWTYLAAWDVHHGRLFGRCEIKNGIGPVNRLVGDVMDQEPYKSARRVFWIMDNCSSHRGEKAVQRLKAKWPNTVLIHTPIHASWLNQIEIYFSILQRKALTPNDFSSLTEAEERLLGFQSHYQRIAKPFEWTFTRKDLQVLLEKIDKQARVA